MAVPGIAINGTKEREQNTGGGVPLAVAVVGCLPNNGRFFSRPAARFECLVQWLWVGHDSIEMMLVSIESAGGVFRLPFSISVQLLSLSYSVSMFVYAVYILSDSHFQFPFC